MKSDFLIIGGGVAGLAAANRLSEQGASVTLLEEGTYPTHKICGEFLSPEAIPILEKWDIFPSMFIDSIQFILPKKQWTMKLPLRAASLSRDELDASLAKRASQKGASIVTQAKVEEIIKPKALGDPYVVQLASLDQYEAKTLLLSAGRLIGKLTNNTPPIFRYVGVKAHFSGISLSQELMMHLFKGAYFGINPIDHNTVNVAGIIDCGALMAKNPKKTFQTFLHSPQSQLLKDFLSKGNCLFAEWLVNPIPEFGVRLRPQNFPNTYFLGDAAGVIPPATGDGLAMGLSSGIMAANYALKGSLDAYDARWKEVFSRRISRGKILHNLFLRPYLAELIPFFSHMFPHLPETIFRMTRGTISI